MSDNMPATITIGGSFTRFKLGVIAAAVERQGVSDEWGNNGLTADEFIKAVEEAATNGETVTLMDDQASGGMFDILEQALRDNGIPYIRHSDARYEYDGIIEWWYNALTHPETCYATQDGKPLIAIESLSNLSTIDEVREFIKKNTPPDLSPIIIHD